MPISPRDDDVDESQEDSDEEMSEAESEENSSKEINLIDVHYGRMEDQEIFELKWAIEGLEKNRKKVLQEIDGRIGSQQNHHSNYDS